MRRETIPPDRQRPQEAARGRFVQWSNSALTTLQMCGERFRRRYIEREYVPPSAKQVRGTVVHRVAREAYQRRLKNVDLPSVTEAKDLAATAFEKQWQGGILLAPDEAVDGLAHAKARAKDFAVDLSGYHVERVAPGITPRAVERRIVVRPRDADIEIHGTIDLVATVPEGEVIRDLKTTEKAPFANAAETSQQLTMYAMVRQAEMGTVPHALALDYLVRTPLRNEMSHKPLTTTRSAEDIGALVRRINTAVAAVARGVFVPANPDSWWCSANYCEFYDSCPYVRRGERRPQS
jgi:hypothetical protein